MTDSKINVLFLSAAGRVGGAERSLYEMLCALPEDKIGMQACVPPGSDLARLCMAAEVPVHHTPMRRFRRTLHPFLLVGQVRALFQSSKAIGKIVAKENIDILHANTDSAALVAWEVSRETKKPFIWHCRDLRPLGPVARILGAASAGVIAISSAVKNHLVNQGVEAEKIHSITNGIDSVRFFKPEDREQIRKQTRNLLGLENDIPVVISIGNWTPWKRHELFLETLAAIRKELPNAVGLMVGGDLFGDNQTYAEYLDARAESLGLADNGLIVLENRDDIPELLAASDLLLSTSENEPFGRVLVEAGVAGLPVVSTNSGGKSEIIIDGKTGRLTNDKEDELATASLELLQNSKKAAALGAQARDHAIDKFNIKRVAAQMIELMGQIANQTK